MGLGKIVGLGNFDITWSNTPYFRYDNLSNGLPTGRTVTISKDTIKDTDFWNRVMIMGKIKFVLYGGKGANGGSTKHGSGGAGSNGSVSTIIYSISNKDTIFILELGGTKHHTDKGGEGGLGPVLTSPTTKEPENPGKAGIHGGGGGGCSGESNARNVYSPETGNVLRTTRGGHGGRGGDGCSLYVKEPGSPDADRLTTAFGGGGGGGAAGFASSADGEGGLAGSPATLVSSWIVIPGAGGSGQREDNKADGQNATSPTGYTSTKSQPIIEVFAPLW